MQSALLLTWPNRTAAIIRNLSWTQAHRLARRIHDRTRTIDVRYVSPTGVALLDYEAATNPCAGLPRMYH